MAETLIPPPPEGFTLVGANNIPPPPPGFEFQERRSQPRVARGISEAFTAGYQGSIAGLVDRGRMPDIVLDPEHSRWYEKLAASASQMFNEAPEMVAGAVVGGAAGTPAGPFGTIVGAGVGSMAVPAAIRESLIQAYSKGAVTSSGDFLNRTGIVIKQTAKEGAIGGLSMGAGVVAGRLVGGAVFASGAGAQATMRATTAAGLTAEIGTMVVAPAALEGRLPEPEDFTNAALLVAGMKGATMAAGKLRSIYARTGVPPEQVAGEAMRDPGLAAELSGKAAELPPVADGMVRLWRGERPDGKGMVGFTAISDFAGIKEKGLFFAQDRAAIETELRGRHGEAGRLVYVDVPKTEVESYRSGNLGADDILPNYVIPDRIAANRQLVGGRTELPLAYEKLAAEENARQALPEPSARAEAFVESPFAEIPQAPGTPKLKLNVNYDYISNPADIGPILARASQLYGDQIIAQTRGEVGWRQTEVEAQQRLASLTGAGDMALLNAREPGTAANAVELSLRTSLMEGAVADFAAKSRAYDPLTAGPLQKAELAAAAERVAMMSANFQGAAAEAGRALNILKNARRGEATAKQVKELLDTYGKDGIDMIAKAAKELDTPEGAAAFARKVTEATTWQKYVEALKSGLVSGPFTQAANILGNATSMVTRPVIDLVASANVMAKPGEKVSVMEPFARMQGNLNGFLETVKIAQVFTSENWRTPMEALRKLDTGVDVKRAEQQRKAIKGDTGVIVRVPFVGLGLMDSMFRTMSERGEAYALATRQAAKEGLTPGTREHSEFVAQRAMNPTKEMQAEMETAGLRGTFSADLGEFGQTAQRAITLAHAEVLIPFVKTPANILKEMTRMTPFAPLVAEWRADVAKGGAARDKALAEVATGSAMMGAVAGLALSGHFSGAGDPDPSKRRVQLAAGWQPYSVKIGDKWYSYQRLQPVGTLIGMAADVAEVWQHMTPEESDKVPKMMAVAFANAITNQTMLQGLTSIIRAITEPGSFGAKFAQNLVAMNVPGILAQSASMSDPLMRDINSIKDAVQNRVPGWREQLIAQRDVFGEQIQNKERVGFLSPITVTTESNDPVRKEAARLKFGVGKAPEEIILPAARDRKLGEVKLTPEQQDIFADKSGKLAYELLQPMVNSPFWAEKPDMVKRRTYEVVFERARAVGRAAALTPDQRYQEMVRIQTEIDKRLAK